MLGCELCPSGIALDVPWEFVARWGFAQLPLGSGMNVLCLCPTAECRILVLQLGNGSLFCFVLVEGVGPGWGREAFSVLRQLLYFSDKCVFLLAKVSYLLLTMCKVVVVSRAGQSLL